MDIILKERKTERREMEEKERKRRGVGVKTQVTPFDMETRGMESGMHDMVRKTKNIFFFKDR